MKNVGPIRHCEPFYIAIHLVSLLSHAACASMSTTTTTTTRDRGDRCGPIEWAQQVGKCTSVECCAIWTTGACCVESVGVRWRRTEAWRRCTAERRSSCPTSTFHRDAPAQATSSARPTTNDSSEFLCIDLCGTLTAEVQLNRNCFISVSISVCIAHVSERRFYTTNTCGSVYIHLYSPYNGIRKYNK